MKKITDEELILYFENDLSKSRMKEIQLELGKNKKLRDRYLSFNQMEEDVLKDINESYEIPEEFHKELSNLLSSKVTKNSENTNNTLLETLKKFSPLSLISGSLISGAAITSFLMIIFAPVLTTTSVVRGPETEIILPANWSVGNDILFTASIENQKYFQSSENIKLKIGTNIFFTLIPIRGMTIDIQLIDSKGNFSKLYKGLRLNKGKTFTTEKLTITGPTGIDKLQIYEEGKIIFESTLNIID